MVNKAQIIADVAKNTTLSKAAATEAVNATIASIIAHADEGVAIPNFGKFEVKKVAERTGRNALTGKVTTVKAHKRVSFKAYKSFKDSVQ